MMPRPAPFIFAKFILYSLLAAFSVACSNSDDTDQPVQSGKAPTLTVLAEQTVILDMPFSIQLQADDADGDRIHFSATGSADTAKDPFAASSPAQFNPDNGIFSWTPNAADAGEYQVTFSATDDSSEQLSSQTTVTLWVRSNAEVYQLHCLQCHGADQTSGSAAISIVDKNVMEIRNAIDNVAVMNSLAEVLSDLEITALAAYLYVDIGAGIVDKPIFYVRRPVQAMILSDPRTNTQLTPGGDLFMKLPGQDPVNITGALTAEVLNVKSAGDVSSPSVNYRGTRVVFSLHEGMLADNTATPNTWNIWEYVYAPDQQPGPNDPPFVPYLNRVIPSILIAKQGDDLDPVYLPNDRIVFTSSRQSTARSSQIAYGFYNEPYFDEQDDEPALNLHVMGNNLPDGNGGIGFAIRQISFNQSDDRFPSVLHTGEIVFSRWERNGKNQWDLFKVNPDGSEMQLLYGAHSHDGGGDQSVFYRAREMADGRLLGLLMSYTSDIFDPNPDNQDLNLTTSGGGALITIDYQGFHDINAPRPGASPVQSQGHVTVSPSNALSGIGLSLGGRYASPFPVWEPGEVADRMLVSWSFCRVAEPISDTENAYFPCNGREDGMSAEPLYGLYIYSMSKNALLPVLLPEAGFALTDPVLLMDRSSLVNTTVNPVPTSIADKSVENGGLNAELLYQGVGAIHVRSIYDSQNPALFGGTVAVDRARLLQKADPTQAEYATRSVRFARLVTPIPRFDGIDNTPPMQSILGYAPVEPDGSIYVHVPANVPFSIELLDENGHNVNTNTRLRHNNWLQVIPGETIECHGCHEDHSNSQPLNDGIAYAVNNPVPVLALTPNQGETMAQTLSRLRTGILPQIGGSNSLNRDLVSVDYWSMATRQPNISMQYNDANRADGNDGLAGNAPIFKSTDTAPCQIGDYADPTSQGSWDANCRININYEDHLQPMWEWPRGMNNQACIDCHTMHTNQFGADGITPLKQVPAGQLDLTKTGPLVRNNDDCGGNSPVVLVDRTLAAGDQFTSFRELRYTTRRLELVLTPNAQQVDEPTGVKCQPIRDANGNVLTDADGNVVYENVGAPAGGVFARGRRFLQVMTDANHASNQMVNHSAMMTRAELRVVAEWIEMRSLYVHDPRIAPRR